MKESNISLTFFAFAVIGCLSMYMADHHILAAVCAFFAGAFFVDTALTHEREMKMAGKRLP